MNAFNRMSPKIDRIQKTVQGGASDIWRTARFNQVKQLLVMQRELTSEEVKKQHDNAIPHEFDCNQLPHLDRYQVFFLTSATWIRRVVR